MRSIGDVQPDLGFEIVDRVVLDDRYADFKRQGNMIRQAAPDPGVERQKEPPRLAGDRIAEIHPNIRARKESDEPVVGKSQIEIRRQLQIADVSLARIAGETNVISCERLEITSGLHVRHPIAKTGDRHDLPFAAAKGVTAGWSD